MFIICYEYFGLKLQLNKLNSFFYDCLIADELKRYFISSNISQIVNS